MDIICTGERMFQQLRQQRWWIYFNDGICWGNCFWEENNEKNIAIGTTDLESTTWVISIAMFATLQHTLFNSCKIRSLCGTTCTCRKFAHQPGGHQVPKLATRSLPLPHCLELPYCHYQLVLSWYLHQLESHQLSLNKMLQWPIDWTQVYLGPIITLWRWRSVTQKETTLFWCNNTFPPWAVKDIPIS